MARAATMVVLALGAALGAASAGRAQPSVRVRAETRIELRTVRQVDHVLVEGALRDDLGSPLSDRELVLRATADDPGAPDRRQAVTTDAAGAFRARMDLSAGGHRLSAFFGGDGTHERVEVERRLDLDRADVRLRVTVPDAGRLDMDRDTHTVEVGARSAEGGGGLVVDLLDELERPLATGVTTPEGRVRFELDASVLGPPGAGRIKARSRADARRAEAQTEVPIVRYRRTAIALEAARDEARPGDSVRLEGTLRDSAGPMDGRAVGLFADGEHLETVLTDREGRFHAQLPLDARHAGRLAIVARYESDAPGRASSESAPVVLEVRDARTTPWPWLLLPLVVCGALLWVITRRAPRRPERSVTAPPEIPVGVAAARRRTLRADRRRVAGRVIDHRDGEPVRGARVHLLRPGGPAVPVALDDRGRFDAGELEPGTWTLAARAPGHVAAEARLTVPHRGEWEDLTVRLESLRARALSPYRRVAEALLPAPRLWSLWTSREVLAEARRSERRAPSLPELTDRVEDAYYGPVEPTEGDVSVIEARAEETLEALRGPGPPEGAPPRSG